MSFSDILSPNVLNQYVQFWVNEDLPNFDLSALAVGDKDSHAEISMKTEGVLAGFPFCEAVLRTFGCDIQWKFTEGEVIKKPSVIAVVKGPANKLLMAERTVLNILGRACGVATLCMNLKNKVKGKWNGELAGTRKTTPGFRIVEKYAMYVGNISSHRYDLSNMIMLKDNHIKCGGGSVPKCIQQVRSKVGKLFKIEIEVSNKNQAVDAAKAGADVIMLDNFTPQDVKSVSKLIKDLNKSVVVESSGGINEENIIEYAVENVDVISSSLFCQGYKCIDLSMNTINFNNDAFTKPPEVLNNTVVNQPAIQRNDNEINTKSSNDANLNTTVKENSDLKRKCDESSPSVAASSSADTDYNEQKPSIQISKSSSNNSVTPTSNQKDSQKQRMNTSTNKTDVQPPRKKNKTGFYDRSSNSGSYNGVPPTAGMPPPPQLGMMRMPVQPIIPNNIQNNAAIIRMATANTMAMTMHNNHHSNEMQFIRPGQVRSYGQTPPRKMPLIPPPYSMHQVTAPRPLMAIDRVQCKICKFSNIAAGAVFCPRCRKKMD